MKSVKFRMSFWDRIKTASMMWWAIVVSGEIECCEEEHTKEKP